MSFKTQKFCLIFITQNIKSILLPGRGRFGFGARRKSTGTLNTKVQG